MADYCNHVMIAVVDMDSLVVAGRDLVVVVADRDLVVVVVADRDLVVVVVDINLAAVVGIRLLVEGEGEADDDILVEQIEPVVLVL